MPFGTLYPRLRQQLLQGCQGHVGLELFSGTVCDFNFHVLCSFLFRQSCTEPIKQKLLYLMAAL